MISGYALDSRDNVWVRPEAIFFDYSDGEEFERSLLNIIKRALDVSSGSKELASAIVDWPTEYHFSICRHNLLRPFSIGAGQRVLELGCGCGAITRYLGESGADVAAVEGSVQRARIAAERCRDLTNVRVYCDNFIDFSSTEKFDFVLLIGVLEYAPKFIEGDDPVCRCLSHARSFLNKNGVLFLAIENQLGLKYLNGCAEDHLGTPYYGLHGLYRDNEPTTFGRVALEKKLATAGLMCHRFYYPFPDYKLPRVILSDTAFSTPGFDASALLAGMASGNGEGEFHPNFHENLAWRPIIDNGLLPQLANSFLILAAATEDAFGKFGADWRAETYTTNRVLAYATETSFVRSSDRMVVEKRYLHPDFSAKKVNFSTGGLLHRANTVCDYIVGRPYLLELQQRLARGEGISGVLEWVAPWFDLLLAHSSVGENGPVLPGDWVNVIPQNCIRASDGRLHRIDQEWEIEGYIPLYWLIVRGLNNSIGFSPTSPALVKMTLRELIVKVASVNGIYLTDGQITDAMRRESELCTLIYGGNETENFEKLRTVINGGCRCHLSDYLLGEFSRNRIAYLDDEIVRVKSTLSWQLSKPLRFISYIWRTLNKKIQKT
ncbi:class I SAM-dependent methyltransferase [Propionivibrio sp.]|uniref:class I SAM-dependent methyltransferase n=1 Tax=Propionivibrio sp. TaxID=2212460 RepID=UPI0039E411D5